MPLPSPADGAERPSKAARMSQPVHPEANLPSDTSEDASDAEDRVILKHFNQSAASAEVWNHRNPTMISIISHVPCKQKLLI